MKILKYALVIFATAKISEKYWLSLITYMVTATDMTLSPDDPGALIEIMTSEKVSDLTKKLIKDDIDKFFFGKHAK